MPSKSSIALFARRLPLIAYFQSRLPVVRRLLVDAVENLETDLGNDFEKFRKSFIDLPKYVM